jgi:hypothetical protein
LGRVSPQDACEVCGRTFLVGEKVHSFVSVEGRHEVCELCVERVAAVGWLPADEDGVEERLRRESERKPGILGRLFSRADEDEEPEVEHFIRNEGVIEPPAPRRREIHELETERYDVEAEWREDAKPAPRRRLAPPAEAEPADEEAALEPSARRRLGGLFAPRRREAEEAPQGPAADLPAPEAVVPESEPERSTPPPAPAPPRHASPAPLPDPAGRGMRPRRLQPNLSPVGRFEQAIARFNSSDAGRTAAGLTRTLGAPSVSVGDHAGAEDVVRITVAWELTWYQWGVDLSDELRPVFELEKGFEVSEIDAAARQWNASATDGRIVMVAPRRREAANGRPVHQ